MSIPTIFLVHFFTLSSLLLLGLLAYRNESLKSMADLLEQVGLPVIPPLYKVSDNFSYVYTMARSKVIFNVDFFVEPRIFQENSSHILLLLSKPSDDGPFSL